MKTAIFHSKPGRGADAGYRGAYGAAGRRSCSRGRTALYGGLALVFAVCTVSCVKSKLYNTPHPLKGAVETTADWSGRGQGVERPTQYTVRIGETAVAATADVMVFPELIVPGAANLYVYNTPEHIAVEGLTASVAMSADGATIEPLPGWLFSASQAITVAADDTTRVEVNMLQQVRRLNFELTVTEGDAEYIASVEGALSGVARTFDIASEEIGTEAASVAPAFVREGDKVTAAANLLGVVPGAGQKLALTLHYSDGQQQTVESDLSLQLEGFNAGKSEPVLLTGNIHAPVAAGAEATITDWESGLADGSGNVVAD